MYFLRTMASLRATFGSFSVLIGLVGLIPSAVPPGFEHMVPDRSDATVTFLYAHFISNTLLLLSGLWLMFGRCSKCAFLVALALLVFYAYMIAVDFRVSALLLVAFSLVCIAILVFGFAPRLRGGFRLDVDEPF